MPLRTVEKCIKRYRETEKIKDCLRSGRPVTITTPANRERLRSRIKRNNHQSKRSLAKSMGISEKSVRRIFKERLKLYSRKLSKGQTLTEPMMAKRLHKSKNMLKLIANGRHKSVVFTDEKIFTVERFHNHQNDRQLLPKRIG